MAKDGFSTRFPHEGRPRLLTERCRRGWSQKEVADRLGTTPLNVGRWERGLTRPGPYFRRQLADLFGCDESELAQLLDPASENQQNSGARATEACLDPTLPCPTFPCPLVGRTREMTTVREHLLSAGGNALVTLQGLPGVGKTALALALASDPQVRADFPQGILWATLGPDPAVSSILARWIGLLEGTQPIMDGGTSLEAQAARLHDLIGSRRLLLVLDDAWRSADVAACLVGGPNCAYLLTTRFPRLAHQMSLEEPLLISPLDEEASLRLVGAFAPRGLALEPEGICGLVRQVGGLPLALSLIGQHLGQQAHSGQPRRVHAAIAELQQVQHRLTLSRPRAPLEPVAPYGETSVSMQASIELSERILSAGARVMWRALCVLPAWPSSFSEEAALAVSRGRVEHLDELSDAGLLESAGPGRYALHPMIADYARIQGENKAVLHQPLCLVG